MMLTSIDVPKWTPDQVIEWLHGVCDDSSWLNESIIREHNITGKDLLLMDYSGLEKLGITEVNLQETLLDAIEFLNYSNSQVTQDTLQTHILRLACQARSLQRQIASEQLYQGCEPQLSRTGSNASNVNDRSIHPKQKVSLDTFVSVSTIVKTVRRIINILNSSPYSKYDEYRSMKSLILALSIELTSTAQRDQFVDGPNLIIERSSKTLADYCDRIVQAARDTLVVQTFPLEKVIIKKTTQENDLGLVIKSQNNGECLHTIQKISPLSPAKKTNKLSEGDEILQFNKFIVGWTAKNVEKLLNASLDKDDVVMIVRKQPVGFNCT